MDDRRHTTSRRIGSTPDAIYAAFLDRDALSKWLPPEGAAGHVDILEPRVGGRFRMTLTFQAATGKSSENTDVVDGRFVDLVRGKRIVQAFEFVSDDPAFAGTMTMTWSLEAVAGGTDVTVVADDVPAGISKADHEEGLASTLANLAAFVE
ncbi:MAG TPA: SRPBCC family protein [Shinella sp.]|jgi:uncharacterized protein YndB with AHSA1/START domain|uniref:SRPBCC family protein n=1 Tax=Shinella sp. TaxID=1870904 RepID=UPI002E13D084|nr:SRPBCC family protein [Shinella sp.]